MLVKDIINAIHNKETTIKKLAQQFNVSDRTVQSKIKALGFIWNSKEAHYEYIGDNEEEVLNTDFESLFNKNNTSQKKVAKIVKSNKDTKGAKNTQRAEGEGYPQQTAGKGKALDKISILLSETTTQNKRHYRGFYFDEDVLAVIDNVKSGNKSELINEVLRQTFKERGLL